MRIKVQNRRFICKSSFVKWCRSAYFIKSSRATGNIPALKPTPHNIFQWYLLSKIEQINDHLLSSHMEWSVTAVRFPFTKAHDTHDTHSVAVLKSSSLVDRSVFLLFFAHLIINCILRNARRRRSPSTYLRGPRGSYLYEFYHWQQWYFRALISTIRQVININWTLTTFVADKLS